ncbi:MAG: rhodanese [Pseudonocardia sp. SCN 72-86]|nr:MAG: rhodanese [Pseudonocardia sp. SCN 72-86]
MSLRKNHRQLIDEATAKITTLSPAEARARLALPGVRTIDIRDPRELDRDGQLPDACHTTRGMLEFWIDPASPYYMPELGEEPELILYCQSGGRSALATAALIDVGRACVAHIAGGLTTWTGAGFPVEQRRRRT